MAVEKRSINDLSRWLTLQAVNHLVVEHEAAFTADDEARATGVPAAHVAKTVVLHDRDGFRLAVIPASRRLDAARVRAAVNGSAHLRLATEPEMAQAFPHYEVGALPPFGPCVRAAEIVDSRLLYHDRILCGGGDHRHGVLVDPRDLLRITEPQVADICEHEPSTHDEDFGELPRL